MQASHKGGGFSLIEVVIAAGIFAGTMATVIALMAVLSRQSAETIESLTAARLPDATKVELDRLAASAGMEALAGRVPEISAPLGEGLALVAPRDGGQVQSLAYAPPANGRIAVDEQYYLLECWRFSQEPLRHGPAKAFLALLVRVSWPYRLPGLPAPVALADRNQLSFAISVNP